MDIQYGNTPAVYWFAFVAAVAVLCSAVLALHRSSAKHFATPNLLAQITAAGGRQRGTASLSLSLLAAIAMVIALIDLRWGQIEREVPQKGLEVVFLLDVSRSMLAEDVAPSRLERAKQDIGDMIAEMAGDRVGLVLFAGDARTHIPLTNHYDDFRQQLAEVGPDDIPRGGSNLGKAIEVATDSFLEKTPDHKAIVLITDGEDHASKPVEVARIAYRESGVRIFAIGVGDMTTGARIPTPSGGARFLEYEGQQVWSKLDGTILQQIASETGGAYIPAGTKHVDMATVYHRFVASVEQREFQTASISSYVPRYHWFLGLALAVLLLDTWMMTPRKQVRRASNRVGTSAAIAGRREAA